MAQVHLLQNMHGQLAAHSCRSKEHVVQSEHCKGNTAGDVNLYTKAGGVHTERLLEHSCEPGAPWSAPAWFAVHEFGNIQWLWIRPCQVWQRCAEHAGPVAYRECVPLQRLGIEPKMNARTVALILGKFLYLFLASLILGLVLGLFSALLLKKYNVSQTPQVLLLTAFFTCCQSPTPCENGL